MQGKNQSLLWEDIEGLKWGTVEIFFKTVASMCCKGCCYCSLYVDSCSCYPCCHFTLLGCKLWRNSGMFKETPWGRMSFILNPLSFNMRSPGERFPSIPDALTISLSDVHPGNNSLQNVITPLVATPTRPFMYCVACSVKRSVSGVSYCSVELQPVLLSNQELYDSFWM